LEKCTVQLCSDVGLFFTGQDRLEVLLDGRVNPGAKHKGRRDRLLRQASMYRNLYFSG